ncbi:hypothetical protein HD553DRAFT_324635 [Filobasidium floriforme]|uniref:uncharacterized protein n=1 Tax=Filobasidium floriforme TaxID=5210 RepID=UPI001E8D0515|nr:uncharacterized protein HD553DRAFT_324635 [Filobasidium floriforme]KAH8083042.1 hypothetical protein HD553DRAFT_324635 [Filobasidium floriforme]
MTIQLRMIVKKVFMSWISSHRWTDEDPASRQACTPYQTPELAIRIKSGLRNPFTAHSIPTCLVEPARLFLPSLRTRTNRQRRQKGRPELPRSLMTQKRLRLRLEMTTIRLFQKAITVFGINLGMGHVYEEQIDISSRSDPQDMFVSNLALLKRILKCCPRVLYGNNVTAECGHVAILAEYKAAHSNAPLREEDMDQGTFWCLFDSPSGRWKRGTGWGQLLYWRRDNLGA